MRSLAWALIQYEWCPYKKGKFGHRNTHTQKGKMMQDTQGEDSHVTGIMHARAKEHQGLLEASKGKKRFFSRAIRNSWWWCTHLDFRHLETRIVGQYTSAVSSHPVLGTFLQQPQDTDTPVFHRNERKCHQKRLRRPWLEEERCWATGPKRKEVRLNFD